MKLSKANIASENDGNEKLKWEKYFITEVTERRNDDDEPFKALYNNDNCKKECILDSSCSHHVREMILFFQSCVNTKENGSCYNG